jgi:carbamate kinase
MVYLDGMQERFAVIALGGNAILRKGQLADPSTQMANLRDAVANLSCALDYYKSFALTHGNGPQVGNDLIRSYAAHQLTNLPEIGLADCVANTQGRIGHWIVREMKNHSKFGMFPVTCVLTHVYVEKNNFTPDEYTKGVGPWLPNTEEARKDFESRGIMFTIGPDQGDLRRVVPSPIPYAIEEFQTISRLIKGGFVTICCGGGGIPVYDAGRDGGASCDVDHFQQSEVVIDKDRASALLASQLIESLDGAQVDLIILMEADGLYRDAKCRAEDFIPFMTLDELDLFLSEKDLDRGSIEPKLEAISFFLHNGGKNAYLGPLNGFEKMFTGAGGVGTRFTSAPQLNLYR